MTRTSYPAGPAFLTNAGLTIEMEGDWKATHEIEKVPFKTNLNGTVGHSRGTVVTKLAGKAVATSSNLAALMAWLYPYSSGMVGQLIFPAVDVPAVIQTRDGRSVTYPASAITKMPDASFAGNEDIFGEFELTCLSAYMGDPTNPVDVVLEQASAYTPPAMDPLARLRAPYAVAWGSTAPFNAIQTSKAGVKFTAGVKLSPVEVDLFGRVNFRIEEVDASAKFNPMNLTSEDFFNFVLMASENAGIGRILGLDGQPLTVTSQEVGGPILTMPLAVPDQGPLGFDSKSRVGEVTLTGNRASTEGVIGNNYTLSVVA